mmetsp:Transcript_39937/g.102142  ORF Transcript_39937/g.102142 Transcript_39937/m.102142 type:complete len:339 (-) Transcript_39937:455-1471(-)
MEVCQVGSAAAAAAATRPTLGARRAGRLRHLALRGRVGLLPSPEVHQQQRALRRVVRVPARDRHSDGGPGAVHRLDHRVAQRDAPERPPRLGVDQHEAALVVPRRLPGHHGRRVLPAPVPPFARRLRLRAERALRARQRCVGNRDHHAPAVGVLHNGGVVQGALPAAVPGVLHRLGLHVEVPRHLVEAVLEVAPLGRAGGRPGHEAVGVVQLGAHLLRAVRREHGGGVAPALAHAVGGARRPLDPRPRLQVDEVDRVGGVQVERDLGGVGQRPGEGAHVLHEERVWEEARPLRHADRAQRPTVRVEDEQALLADDVDAATGGAHGDVIDLLLLRAGEQ